MAEAAITSKVQILKVAAAITGVEAISGPGISREMIDVTDLDATWHAYIAGLLEGGEVTLTLVFDPDNATHELLYTDLVDGSSDVYSVKFVGTKTATFTFNAHVSAITPSGTRGDKQVCDVTLKVTGLVTINAFA